MRRLINASTTLPGKPRCASHPAGFFLVDQPDRCGEDEGRDGRHATEHDNEGNGWVGRSGGQQIDQQQAARKQATEQHPDEGVQGKVGCNRRPPSRRSRNQDGHAA
ncbi:MAG: hypothetical protein AB7S71_00615 [Dongiaceae bacterium]